MVADQETSHLSYQYSAISPAVEREVIVGEEEVGEEEEVAMLAKSATVTGVIVQQVKSESNRSTSMETKVYKRRWIMLTIFVLVFMTNAFQWIQFSIINNLITKWVSICRIILDTTWSIFLIYFAMIQILWRGEFDR